MRTIRQHATPVPVHRLQGFFPGLETHRIWFGVEIARVVSEAIAVRVDWRHVLLHLESDAMTIRDRAGYVAELRRNGVGRLASQLEAAVVPPRRLLALCDFEGATWVSVTEIAALLGEESVERSRARPVARLRRSWRGSVVLRSTAASTSRPHRSRKASYRA